MNAMQESSVFQLVPPEPAPVTGMVKFEWPKGDAEPGFPIEPFEDCVYIEQIVETTSKGGIVIPSSTEHSKMPMGRVVAVGPGKMYYAPFNAAETFASVVFVPTRLKVGDTVLWGRYRTGGEPMEFNGKRYVAAREGDLGGRVIDLTAEIRLAPQA
jgi:co-chaperonin GroES (HSP10)